MNAPIGGDRLQVTVDQRFDSGFSVDVELDVDVTAGSMLVVFGPSGSGKTTLLRQIAGLERPPRGRIVFDNDVWCDTAAGVWQPPQRRRVGIVFQEPTLFPHLTVRQNIGYALDANSHRTLIQAESTLQRKQIGANSESIPTPVEPQAVRRTSRPDIAVLLGVADLGDRYPRVLSGGEAQRVALARALTAGPRLLLLDEPFAALDAPTRARLRRDVRALLQTTGIPAILVTHDRTEAMAMGDLIAVVIGGRVRQVGAIAEVFSRPADAEVAASLGVEAVLPARIVDVSEGIVEVAVAGVVLHVAERDPISRGAQVFACIRAEDVTLETRAPGQASVRNHLAARVVHISPEGPIDRVALDCGFPLDALITRRSREEMQLVPGAHVTAAIKATSVHLVPRA